MKVILFDIDYTLLRTGGVGKTAVDAAFKELFGVEQAWGETSAAGKTDPLVFQEIASRVLGRNLTQAEYRSAIEIYERAFEAAIADSPNFEVLPAVPALLNRLSTMEDVALGVQTGNIMSAAKLKLKKAKLDLLFSFGGYGDDRQSKTEIVEAAIKEARARLSDNQLSFYVVGDSPADIKAGKVHGCATVGVATGDHSTEELRNADYVCGSFCDLEPLLQFFGGPFLREPIFPPAGSLEN